MSYDRKNLQNPKTKETEEIFQGFSFTVLFFGFFVPLFRKDFKWFSIHLAIISFIFFLCTSLGTSEDSIYFFWVVWNSFFACYYNYWHSSDLLKKGYVEIFNVHPKRTLRKKKNTDDKDTFFILKKKYRNFVEKLSKKYKNKLTSGNYHLDSLFAVFFIVTGYFIISTIFIGVFDNKIPPLSRISIEERQSSTHEKNIEKYINFVVGEIKYIKKVEKRRSYFQSLNYKTYSEIEFKKDLTSIKKHIKEVEGAKTPAGFRNLNEDLKGLLILYTKLLESQYNYKITSSEEHKNSIVTHKFQYIKKEELFVEKFSKHLLDNNIHTGDKKTFGSIGYNY